MGLCGEIQSSPTRLEGMETVTVPSPSFYIPPSPTRLEGMETKLTAVGLGLSALESPTRLEGMETDFHDRRLHR